jgi:hypothetical protein
MKTNKNKGNENIYRKMLVPGNYLEIPWCDSKSDRV